jgi:hypothetical protein
MLENARILENSRIPNEFQRKNRNVDNSDIRYPLYPQFIILVANDEKKKLKAKFAGDLYRTCPHVLVITIISILENSDVLHS